MIAAAIENNTDTFCACAHPRSLHNLISGVCYGSDGGCGCAEFHLPILEPEISETSAEIIAESSAIDVVRCSAVDAFQETDVDPVLRLSVEKHSTDNEPVLCFSELIADLPPRIKSKPLAERVAMLEDELMFLRQSFAELETRFSTLMKTACWMELPSHPEEMSTKICADN